MIYSTYSPFPPLVSVPVLDSDPLVEVDIPEVYIIEHATESELEPGNKLACKVSSFFSRVAVMRPPPYLGRLVCVLIWWS